MLRSLMLSFAAMACPTILDLEHRETMLRIIHTDSILLDSFVMIFEVAKCDIELFLRRKRIYWDISWRAKRRLVKHFHIQNSSTYPGKGTAIARCIDICKSIVKTVASRDQIRPIHTCCPAEPVDDDILSMRIDKWTSRSFSFVTSRFLIKVLLIVVLSSGTNVNQKKPKR